MDRPANNSVSPSTGYSPFMLQFGEQPRGLPDVVGGGVVNSPMATNLVHEIFANVNAARDLLQKQADEFRRAALGGSKKARPVLGSAGRLARPDSFGCRGRSR